MNVRLRQDPAVHFPSDFTSRRLFTGHPSHFDPCYGTALGDLAEDVSHGRWCTPAGCTNARVLTLVNASSLRRKDLYPTLREALPYLSPFPVKMRLLGIRTLGALNKRFFVHPQAFYQRNMARDYGMTIAVTGSSGTVGKEVVKLCAEKGHSVVQVSSIDICCAERRTLTTRFADRSCQAG